MNVSLRLTFLLNSLCWSWIRWGVIASGWCSLYCHLISVDKHKTAVYHHMSFLWNERFKSLDLVKTIFLCWKATSRVQTDWCKRLKSSPESWHCFSSRCDQGSISHFWPQLLKAEEERGARSLKVKKMNHVIFKGAFGVLFCVSTMQTISNKAHSSCFWS